MPFRRIPSSMRKIVQALQAAQSKYNATGTNQAFSVATKTALDTLLPLLMAELSQKNTSSASKYSASRLEDESMAKAKMYISHYFQVLNLGIERKIYKASERIFYGLNQNRKSVPKLGKENDVIYWAEEIARGEASRIASGGIPMANPSAAEVHTAASDFITKHKDQSEKKDSHGKESKDVKDLFGDARQLVIDIWDEVEFAFRRRDRAAKRKRAKEWGVFYDTRPEERSKG